MFSLFRKTKAQKVREVLEMLAAYHAVPLDNELFKVQYRHMITMLLTLERK